MPRPKKLQTPQGSGPLDSFVEREVVPKKTRGPVRKSHCRHQQQLYRRRRRRPHPRRLRRLLLHRLHQDLRVFMMGREILPDPRWKGSW